MSSSYADNTPITAARNAIEHFDKRIAEETSMRDHAQNQARGHQVVIDHLETQRGQWLNALTILTESGDSDG